MHKQDAAAKPSSYPGDITTFPTVPPMMCVTSRLESENKILKWKYEVVPAIAARLLVKPEKVETAARPQGRQTRYRRAWRARVCVHAL